MGKCCRFIPFRIWIAFFVFLTTYVNYTSRVNMSVAIISMVGSKSTKPPLCLREEKSKATTTAAVDGSTTIAATTKLPDYGPRYDWSENVQAVVLGSYYYSYVVASLFGGAITEWLGPFHVLFWSHIGVSIFNSLSVWAAYLHYGALITCRIFIGIAGGFTYPALQTLIANWAPPAEKGKFVACLMGNTVGTCVTWPLVGVVTMAWGWSWGFHVVSIQNVVYAILLIIVVDDTPDTSRWITTEEKELIAEAKGSMVTSQKRIAPYLKIFSSLAFWMLCILHFGNLWGLYVQIQTVPKYLSEVVGYNLRDSGGMSALPHLVRLFTGLMFGVLEDALVGRGIFSQKFSRKFFVVFSHILPGVCLVFISLVGCSKVMSIVLLVISMGLNGAVTVTNLRNPQDLAPNFAGTIFGIISCVGGCTGFIVPAILGALGNDKSYFEWGVHFILGGSLYIIPGIVFILFGSTQLQSWNEPKKLGE